MRIRSDDSMSHIPHAWPITGRHVIHQCHHSYIWRALILQHRADEHLSSEHGDAAHGTWIDVQVTMTTSPLASRHAHPPWPMLRHHASMRSRRQSSAASRQHLDRARQTRAASLAASADARSTRDRRYTWQLPSKRCVHGSSDDAHVRCTAAPQRRTHAWKSWRAHRRAAFPIWKPHRRADSRRAAPRRQRDEAGATQVWKPGPPPRRAELSWP